LKYNVNIGHKYDKAKNCLVSYFISFIIDIICRNNFRAALNIIWRRGRWCQI